MRILLLLLLSASLHSQTVFFDSFNQVTMTVTFPDSVTAGATTIVSAEIKNNVFTDAYFSIGAAWLTTDPGSNTTAGFMAATLWERTDTGGCPNLGEAAGGAGYGLTHWENSLVGVPAGLCGTAWLGFTLAFSDRPYSTVGGPTMSNCRGQYAIWVPVTIIGGCTGTPTPTNTPVVITTTPGNTSGLLLASYAVPNPYPTGVSVLLGRGAKVTVEVYTSGMTLLQRKVLPHVGAGWTSIGLDPVSYHGSSFIRVLATGGGLTEQNILRAYF